MLEVPDVISHQRLPDIVSAGQSCPDRFEFIVKICLRVNI